MYCNFIGWYGGLLQKFYIEALNLGLLDFQARENGICILMETYCDRNSKGSTFHHNIHACTYAVVGLRNKN